MKKLNVLIQGPEGDAIELQMNMEEVPKRGDWITIISAGYFVQVTNICHTVRNLFHLSPVIICDVSESKWCVITCAQRPWVYVERIDLPPINKSAR